MAAILRGGGDQVLTVNLRGPPNSRAPFTGFYCIVEKHLLTRQIVRDMNILYTMAAIVMAGNFIVKRVKSILIVKRTCKNMSKSSIKVWNSNVTIVVNISLNNQIGQDTWKWCTKRNWIGQNTSNRKIATFAAKWSLQKVTLLDTWKLFIKESNQW